MTTFSTQRWTLAACAVAALTGSLSGCVPLVLGGAVAGTAIVASDRRTSGTQLEDEGIELRSANRIREMVGDRVHVNITSYNRQVLLTGEVPFRGDTAVAVAYRVAVRPAGAAIANQHYLVYGAELSANASDFLTIGLALAATDVVTVYAATADLSFGLFGDESAA